MSSIKITIADCAVLEITTPDGVILISRLPVVGTQILAYDNPDNNPVGILELKDQTEVKL